MKQLCNAAVNQANTTIDQATAAIDEILLLMAQLQEC